MKAYKTINSICEEIELNEASYGMMGGIMPARPLAIIGQSQLEPMDVSDVKKSIAPSQKDKPSCISVDQSQLPSVDLEIVEMLTEMIIYEMNQCTSSKMNQAMIVSEMSNYLNEMHCMGEEAVEMNMKHVMFSPQRFTRRKNGEEPRMDMSLGYQFPSFVSELQEIIGSNAIEDNRGSISVEVDVNSVKALRDLAKTHGMKIKVKG